MTIYKSEIILVASTRWLYYDTYLYNFLKIRKHTFSFLFLTIELYTSNIQGTNLSHHSLEADKIKNKFEITTLKVFKSVAISILNDKLIENKETELQKVAYKINPNITFAHIN